MGCRRALLAGKPRPAGGLPYPFGSACWMNSSVAPSQRTAHIYPRGGRLCSYFHRSSERLGPSHIREMSGSSSLHRKLSPPVHPEPLFSAAVSLRQDTSTVYLPDEIPFPKCPRKLPTVLSPEEVARLIDSARNLMHRTMLMTLYVTGPVLVRAVSSGRYPTSTASVWSFMSAKARAAGTATFC